MSRVEIRATDPLANENFDTVVIASKLTLLEVGNNMPEDKKQQQQKRKRNRRPKPAPAQTPAKRRIPQKIRKVFQMSPIQGSALARQMAIPDVPQGQLLRMPTVDMPSVGVVASQDTFAATPVLLGNSAGKLPVASDGTLLFLTYGQPGRSLVYGPVHSNLAVDAGTVAFSYSDDEKSTLVASAFALTKAGPVYGGGSTISGRWNPKMTLNANVPGEDFRSIGHSAGRSYVYVNGTEKMSFFMYNGSTNAAIASPLVVDIYRWVGPYETPEKATALAYTASNPLMANFSYTPSESGYYTFDWSIGVIDNASINSNISMVVALVTSVANPSFMVHRSPRVTRNQDIGEYVRRTGFSILITNTSAAISKQGNVIAARIVAEGPAKGVTIGKESEATISTLANKYTGAAEKGVYSYMDFDQYAERFAQGFNEYGCPVFDLDYNGFVHAILVSNPNPTVQNSFLVTVYGVYEFFTDNPIYTAMPSHFDHNALCDARRVNNSTSYFYENPLHLSDIWKFIKESFGVMRRAAVPLGMAASAMFPESTPFVMPVAHMLQS